MCEFKKVSCNTGKNLYWTPKKNLNELREQNYQSDTMLVLENWGFTQPTS